MKISHPILDTHDAIGWDIDGTLVNGPNSVFWRSYIVAHPEKKHYLVTFRDRAWAEQVWQELAPHGVSDGCFEGLLNCPEPIHDGYMVITSPRNAAILENWRKQGMTPETEKQVVSDFLTYKGRACKEVGATVLVDDLPDWVKDGCDLHGVAFVHAHDKISQV